MKKTIVAVVGDPTVCAHVVGAIPGARPFPPNETLEPLDEFSARRWFSRNQANVAFICVSPSAQKTVNAELLVIQGSINLINAAIGFTDRIRLVGVDDDACEYIVLKKLGLLYKEEKGVDFETVPRRWDSDARWMARCVLSMGVSPSKEKESSTEGQGQGREVRDSVLPQSPGTEQHRSFTATLLEVQVPAAAQETRGDLRPESAAHIG